MRTKQFLISFVILTTIFLLACGGGGGGSNPVAVETGSTVMGSIKGQLTGEGKLANIPVYLVNVNANILPSLAMRANIPATSQLMMTVTDSLGCFEFKQVPEGNYNLIAQKDKFNSAIMKNVSVRAQTEAIAPVDLVLKLTATGEISGKVSVPEGFPKGGVIAFISGTSFAAFTDSDGKFLISGVPVGQYSMAFMGQGLNQQTLSGVSVESGKATAVPEISLLSAVTNAFVWKGVLSAAPSNPQLNWVYLNSGDGKTYIWNGSAWDMMMDSAGNNNPVVNTFTWKGMLEVPPATPQPNWAYFNTSDGKSYIFNGENWEVMIDPRGDHIPPQIYNVELFQIETNKAALRFSGNEPCIYRVDYGETTAYGKIYSFNDRYDQFFWCDLDITGLSSLNLKITLTDLAGNNTVSENKTLQIDSANLLIQNALVLPDVLNARLSFSTSEMAYCTVEWGVAPTYSSQAYINQPGEETTSFVFDFVGLAAETDYAYKIRAFDKNGKEVNYSGNFSTTKDLKDPEIKLFETSAGSQPDSVFVKWQTDEPVTVKVNYGLNIESYQAFTPSVDAASSGEFQITGLQPGNVYSFQLEVTDLSNKTVKSGNQTFSLPLPKPVIEAARVEIGTSYFADIIWSCDINIPISKTGINWGETTDYGNVTEIPTTSFSNTGNFGLNLTNLKPSTTYHCQVWAENSTGVTLSEDLTFTLPSVSMSFNVSHETAEEGKSVNLSFASAEISAKRLKFYRGSTLLVDKWFSNTVSDFNYTWSNIPAGTFDLYAIVTDQFDNDYETEHKQIIIEEVDGVGGDLIVNVTWTLANSPYRLLSDIHIKNGATLTIEPGVLIRADSQSTIWVESSNIVATGNQDSKIVFENVNIRVPEANANSSVDLDFIEINNISLSGCNSFSLKDSLVSSLSCSAINSYIAVIENNLLNNVTFYGNLESVSFASNSLNSSLYFAGTNLTNYSVTNNWFSADLICRLDNEAVLVNGTLDFANNYWSSTDLEIISQKIQMLSGASAIDVGAATLGSILDAPPAGLVAPDTLPYNP